MKASKAEEKEFVLGDKADLEILSKAKELEKKQLTKEDKEIVLLIKTQLRKEWRAPLIEKLDELIKKYLK